jgi:tRNA dimethylallyltransferase
VEIFPPVGVLSSALNSEGTDPVPSDIVAVVGPTGTGKTGLAIELALRLGAEIVNCDSRQVYRGLDIGSAKPDATQRAAVPHHLFDVVDPDQEFDCARYRDLARAATAAIRARGRRVVLVGGTGLYLKVLRYGLFPGPPRDARLRARLEAIEAATPGALHARLAAADPESARRLHPHDRMRLVRALEVCELSGRPLSAWQAEHGFRATEIDCRVVGLALAREELYARIEHRCRRMLEVGLVEEVRDLQRRGYGRELPALQSIGYREIGRHLAGECDLDTAAADMVRATRRFAKRQLTWFRADPTVDWVDAASADVVEQVLEKCAEGKNRG